MKTALCLSGYFNSSRDKSSLGVDGYQHIKKHILVGNDVDVYIHSWDLANEKLINETYGSLIKASIFEDQIDFKPLFIKNGLHTLPIHYGATPFWNVFSQYYSVQKSFELMVDSGLDYDCVIKARFDLGRINRNTSGPHNLQNPHPVQCINFDPKLDMSKVYMADWQYLQTEGPADMWFYSNKENMSKFSQIYTILSEDIKIDSQYEKWAGTKDGGIVNTIKGWKWFLLKTKLWYKKIPLKTTWE
jgi:hypothetical protein